jgi:hypothetical protein
MLKTQMKNRENFFPFSLSSGVCYDRPRAPHKSAKKIPQLERTTFKKGQDSGFFPG